MPIVQIPGLGRQWFDGLFARSREAHFACPNGRACSQANTNFPVCQSRASRASSITEVQLGINRRMLYSDAKMFLYMFLIFK